MIEQAVKRVAQSNKGDTTEPELCVQLTGSHVPAGGTRTVQVVVYYSGDTVMR